jgi:hypothetical protein
MLVGEEKHPRISPSWRELRQLQPRLNQGGENESDGDFWGPRRCGEQFPNASQPAHPANGAQTSGQLSLGDDGPRDLDRRESEVKVSAMYW